MPTRLRVVSGGTGFSCARDRIVERKQNATMQSSNPIAVFMTILLRNVETVMVDVEKKQSLADK